MSNKEEAGTRYNGFVEKRELVEVVDEGGGGGGGWRTGVESGQAGGALLWLRRTPSAPKHVRILAAGFCALLAVCVLLALGLLYTASCSDKGDSDVCMSEDCVKTAARLLEAMDSSVDPCVDFFEYACGTWNRMHVIPADKGSINIFELLTDQLQVVLKGLLEEPFDDEENTFLEDSATRKAKLFYNTCLNIEKIRKVGDSPLREALILLGGWPIVTGDEWKEPTWTLEYLLAKVRTQYNEGIIVEQWIDPDDKNSSANIVQLDQMKLALPTKDSYLNKEMYPNHIPAYRRYMTEVALILGANANIAARDVEEVIQFEIELANVSIPELDKLDAIMNYKKLTIRRLSESVPQIDWLQYLRYILNDTVTEDESIVTYAMPYLVKMGPILARTSRRTIYNYVLWRVVMSVSPHLIDDYQSKNIEFRQIIHGVLAERNRWRQCVDWTNKMMGMAVGKLYIRKNFNQHNKETALRMIHTIREAFNELLEENHWMDIETKAVAKEKANAMNERIGFPEMINHREQLNNEYKLLMVGEGEFIVNLLRVYRWEAARNLAKWKKPVDRDRWSTEPAIINAFYSPNKNDIVFPAGILQPLFYSPHFPKSLNYGGIGVVIGHEITHGFDDKGRLFDKDGNMMQWWNNNTVKEFRERAQCFVDQYNRYKFNLVDKFVDGRMTQGENIADNGGLKQSYRAYRKWVRAHGEEPRLPGLDLSHDQLFFLNFAQIWCGTSRPEEALIKHHTAVHSPSPIRVIGPLSNSLDFSRAYSCPPGSPMNPMAKCSVW